MSGKVGRMAEPRARPRPRKTVGQKAGSRSWQPIFTGGVVALAVSVIVFVIVAADSFGDSGGGSGGSSGFGPSPTAAATEPGASTVDGGGTEPASTTGATGTSTPSPGPDGSTVVACGDILVPLDKEHRLPADCIPAGLNELPGDISAQGAQYLRGDALAALQEMFAAARKEGHQLVVNSSYRSYDTQAATYNYWVGLYGKEQADRTSARPGHSEHQLGTTADVGAGGRFLEDFTGSPEARWLADNSWKYGFIISYPEGKEEITGYAYEPWHVRFVGKDVAARVHSSGLTLREFLLR